MMSQNGQTDDPSIGEVPIGTSGIVTNSFAIDGAAEWGWHRHDADELLWGTRGSLVVETARGFHAVPWTVGLWIPAGEPHRVTASGGTEFFCSYLAAGLGPSPRDDVGAVGIPAAARALFDELSTRALEPVTRRLAEQLLPRLLDRAELVHLDLAFPEDDRARRIADAVRSDPADARTLSEWGAVVGGSERNLSRLFRRETSLSFAQWRTRARMLAAVELLAAGAPVGAVGRRVGYATPSAFVQAFRRELGTTPGTFALAAQ
ncbi:helix-turn-helix domain-containing protein [Microbacterium sp.]|uniref:helix-turn-helix domain-containing protein n=1 Tax=Microbacterium sp. TaxID=51671 RepID=UPI0039E4248A